MINVSIKGVSNGLLFGCDFLKNDFCYLRENGQLFCFENSHFKVQQNTDKL